MNNTDINVMCDLDNTLIWSIDISKMKTPPKWAKHFRQHVMEDNYVIFERPGLQKFLTWLFQNFNVNVWSAASPEYVEFIAKNIIENGNLVKGSRKRRSNTKTVNTRRQLDYVLNSDNCKESQKVYGKDNIKQLDLLWDLHDLEGFSSFDTLIIDDLKQVIKENPDNSIRIKKFVGGEKSIHDKELIDVKKKLMKIKGHYKKNINKNNFKLLDY
jgi:hypothetical protein